MKHAKKLLALLLAAVMLPALPGCQGEDNTVYALTKMQRVDKDGEILYEEYLTFDENGRVASSGSNDPTLRPNATYTYSEDGYRIYEFREGYSDYEAEMVVDENLRLTQITYPHTNEEDQKPQWWTYTYDQDGRLLTRTGYVEEQKRWEDTYFYLDDYCFKTEHTYYSEGEDFPASRTYYEYNSKGDETAYRRYGQYGGLSEGWDDVNTYDWRGNLIKTQRTLVNSDREPTVETYTYDWRGRLVSQEGVAAYTYTYDQKGRLLTKRTVVAISDSQGRVNDLECTYDDHGNLKTREWTRTNADGSQDYWKETYTYTSVELTGINRTIYELLKLELPDLSPYLDRLKEIPIR